MSTSSPLIRGFLKGSHSLISHVFVVCASSQGTPDPGATPPCSLDCIIQAPLFFVFRRPNGESRGRLLPGQAALGQQGPRSVHSILEAALRHVGLVRALLAPLLVPLN